MKNTNALEWNFFVKQKLLITSIYLELSLLVTNKNKNNMTNKVNNVFSL